jgi:toxin-antitoxin system PIN domain toxin
MPQLGEIKLLDANVWLALAFSDHAFHSVAAGWFDRQTDGSCAFCRITQLALLRFLTNSKIMGAFVQTQQQAWATYDRYIGDPRILFLPEPAEISDEFRKFTQKASPSNDLWTDAYLAGFAVAEGLTISTFDADFQKFGRLKFELLTSA